MRKQKLIAFLLMLVMVATVAFTGCNKSTTGSSNSNGAKPDAEQHLSLGMVADVRTLDSSKATDLYSATVQLETQEGLVRVTNTGSGDVIEKAGALNWDISTDGLTYTFHLRDYNWSDGKPVTADDYAYAWKRLLDPATKAGYAYLITDKIKGAADFNAGKGSADNVGIVAKDPKTLVVTLTHPVAFFDKLLGMQGLLPLRKDIVEAGGDTYGQDPSKLVYCGPFTVSEWTKGSKIVLKKNANYWDAANVKLGTVNLPVIKEENARMKSFETKELDAAAARGDYKKKYEADKSLTHVTGYSPSTSYIFFNAKDTNKLFTNRNVRMAFSLAWDKETYVSSIMKRGVAAYGWAPYALMLGSQEYRKQVPEQLKDVKDDPKQLLVKGLTELGMDPDPSKLTVQFLNSGTTDLDKQIGEYLQNQWQTKLGVKVTLDAVTDFPQFLDRIDNNQFQISSMGWTGDYNDPMTFFDMWTSANAVPGGNNSAKWESKDYDNLITQLSNEQDDSKRLQLFKQCEQMLIVDQAVISPMNYQDINTFEYPYVKGLQIPLFGPVWNFKTAYTAGRQ